MRFEPIRKAVYPGDMLRPTSWTAAILLALLLSSLLPALSASAQEPGGILARLEPVTGYRGTANREIETWKREIADYALRHYGVRTHGNRPARIILHYTETAAFPRNLLDSSDFAGERPGLASHFVMEERDGEAVVHQLLPLDVMGRAAFGANLDSVSIELVAADEEDLLAKPVLLDGAVALVAELMAAYGIGADGVWGHHEVDAALAAASGDPFFDLTVRGVFVPRKSDPGERVMAYVRERIAP